MSENNPDEAKAWLEEGIRFLSEHGNAHSLYIGTLASGLESTEEIFLSHFKNWCIYIEELMKYWKEINLETIRKVDKGRGNQYSKLHKILNLVLNLSEKTLIAIRAWAVHDPIVRKYQDQIDRYWINYIFKLMNKIYSNKKRALNKAYKAYAGFIGYHQIKHHFSEYNNEDIMELLEEIFDTQLYPEELKLEKMNA